MDALFSWDGVCVGTAQYSTVLTNTCRHVPNPTKLLFSGDTLCGTAVHHTSRYTRPNLKKKVYFQTRSKNSVEAFFSSIIDSTFFPHQPTVFPLRKNFDVSKVPKKFRLPYIRVFFFFFDFILPPSEDDLSVETRLYRWYKSIRVDVKGYEPWGLVDRTLRYALLPCIPFLRSCNNAQNPHRQKTPMKTTKKYITFHLRQKNINIFLY